MEDLKVMVTKSRKKTGSKFARAGLTSTFNPAPKHRHHKEPRGSGKNSEVKIFKTRKK